MKDLNWKGENLIPLDFVNHYWQFLENNYSQFSTGNHIVTKAYNSEKDYIGFTDDYDFCWGPANQGDYLPIQNYPEDWEKDEEMNFEYTIKEYGYNEYSSRLWGVYSQTLGEIYLLKSKDDLTDWEKHKQLLFAPSGSKSPTIVFNKSGNYEIAVEVEPSGTDIKEIWLMSYPYEGDSIRKICNGKSPQLVMNHNKNLILFYTNQEQTKIFYRLSSESYSTEYEISNIYIPEKKLSLSACFKVFEPKILDKPYSSFPDTPKEYEGEIIVFYEREEDYQPYKYSLTNGEYYYKFMMILNLIENSDIDFKAQNIDWEDVRYLINVFSSDNSKLYIEGQRGQSSIEKNLNEYGEVEFLILPYDTVYKVKLEKNDLIEDSWGVLINNNDSTKEMDIYLPFLEGDSKPKENNDLDYLIENILWELAGVDLNIHTFKGIEDLDNTTVTIKEQSNQPKLSDTTDSSGMVYFKDVIPSETVYEVIIDDSSYGISDSISLLINQQPGSSVNIELPFIDTLTENNDFNFNIKDIIWESMYITITFTLFDMSGNTIDSANITIYSQKDMQEINLTTDSNGKATADLLVYETAYDLLIEKTGYISEDNLDILVQNVDTKQKNMDLYLSDGEFDKKENNDINFSVDSVLWLEV